MSSIDYDEEEDRRLASKQRRAWFIGLGMPIVFGLIAVMFLVMFYHDHIVKRVIE